MTPIARPSKKEVSGGMGGMIFLFINPLDLFTYQEVVARQKYLFG